MSLAKSLGQTLGFAKMHSLLASLCSIDHVATEEDLELANREERKEGQQDDQAEACDGVTHGRSKRGGEIRALRKKSTVSVNSLW